MQATAKIQPAQEIMNYAEMIKRIALWLGLEDVEKFVQMNPLQGLMGQQQPQVQPQQAMSPQGTPQAGGNGGGGLSPQVIAGIAQRMQGQRAPITR